MSTYTKYKTQSAPQVATDMSLFSGVREGPPIEVLHMKARHDRDPSTVKDNIMAFVIHVFLGEDQPNSWRVQG